MKKPIILPVKGTRDFYPDEMARRSWLYRTLRRVSESYGYQEYEGPFLEPFELYAAKSGDELVREQAFVFPDKGGELITLRPELTPTLTRMVAQRQRQLVFPLRWWSFGPMWRYERPQKGRGREFFQWNIDLIGVDTPEADAEIAAIGGDFLLKVGLTPAEVRINVNNRRLMDAELEALGIAPDQRPEIFRLIDRRDRLPAARWRVEAEKAGLTARQIDGLLALLEDNTLWQKSAELVHFFAATEALGVGNFMRFDPNTIRGLDYYTGTVFECRDEAKALRAIFGGGRYDNLVADVGGDPLPGVGFAMGDMVILALLEKLSRLPDQSATSPAPVIVTVFDADHTLESLKLAAELRQAGLNTACYPEALRLSKQFKYADRIGARVAVVLGPDELAHGLVTVKDLATGEQSSVARPEAAAHIRRVLAQQAP